MMSKGGRLCILFVDSFILDVYFLCVIPSFTTIFVCLFGLKIKHKANSFLHEIIIVVVVIRTLIIIEIVLPGIRNNLERGVGLLLLIYTSHQLAVESHTLLARNDVFSLLSLFLVNIAL